MNTVLPPIPSHQDPNSFVRLDGQEDPLFHAPHSASEIAATVGRYSGPQSRRESFVPPSFLG